MAELQPNNPLHGISLKEILNFLNILTADSKYRPASKLKDCIEEIVTIEPSLSNEPSYKRLEIIVRRFE